MSPAEFVAMQGVTPRVSKAPPAVVATCTPEVAAFIDPAGTLQDAGLVMVNTWAPLPGFGPFLQADATADMRTAFPDAIEDPVKLARFHRAQRLTGLKLAAAMPGWAKAWIKTHTFPAYQQFVPNLPAKYPAWTYR